MDDCAVLTEGRGLMVLFGTGRYLNTDDFNDTTQQSLYGIWDWGKIWEATDDLATAKGKYLGTLQADRSLSALGTGVSLLEQSVVSQTTQWYKVSNNAIDWYRPQSGAGSHMGWVFDLPQTGERCLQEPELRSGIVVMISTTPSNSPCDAGGSSTLWGLDACSGGSTLFWDENDDGEIDELDDPVSGKINDGIIPDILIISDTIYYPDDDDDDDDDEIEGDEVKADPVGMFFWRTLER
jgi:type IV pilus assembly protein PilY1